MSLVDQYRGSKIPMSPFTRLVLGILSGILILPVLSLALFYVGAFLMAWLGWAGLLFSGVLAWVTIGGALKIWDETFGA